ncbi:MAG: hypothetical protein H7836_04380 [Magnetococcus sp. YQC-3]
MELAPHLKPEEMRYHLKAKVIAKDVTYQDEQSTGTTNVTEKLVFLLIEPGTQRDLFYACWLPDTNDTPSEIVCMSGHPLNTSFRAALWRRSQFVGDTHLFVMSKGAEEVLKEMNGRSISFDVLGQQEDSVADTQRDWDLPYNKNRA